MILTLPFTRVFLLPRIWLSCCPNQLCLPWIVCTKSQVVRNQPMYSAFSSNTTSGASTSNHQSINQKVTVAIEQKVDGAVVPVPFRTCMVEQLHHNHEEVFVTVEENVELGQVILRKADASAKHKCLLVHAPDCPIKHTSAVEWTTHEAKVVTHVHAAVGVIVQSSDDHILLTQRAHSMKAFPGAWVVPGGYVDKGETLRQCGMRELFEETGLDFRSHAMDAKILLLWESVYPPSRKIGLPMRYALVYYLLLRVQQNAQDINSFNISPNEVETVGWIPKKMLRHVIGHIHDKKDEQRPVEVWKAEMDSTEQVKLLKYKSTIHTLFPLADSITSGTVRALREVLR